MPIYFRRIFSSICLFTVLVIAPMWGQQSVRKVACPNEQAGIYVLDSAGWHRLTQDAPLKMKAKHAFLSGMSYGAIAAPVVVIYSGAHASTQVRSMRPEVCIDRVIVPGTPMLVRLLEKKSTRELDSGHLRAIPFSNDSHQGRADAGSIVPTTTFHTGDGMTVLVPQDDVVPGEYAVMFGATNLSIADFGVVAAQ